MDDHVYFRVDFEGSEIQLKIQCHGQLYTRASERPKNTVCGMVVQMGCFVGMYGRR